MGSLISTRTESCEDDPAQGVLTVVTEENVRKSKNYTRGSRTEATCEVIARSAVLQGNASVHTARVSRQALMDTGFSEIDHPPSAKI
ncbi:hypothetical protein EVAR_71136_1 [Eumeta japonica]|uniref:Uncharacterized protein n=1 Tax=Eumeta variegata TaxID=151549 RepID=A0A4C1ZMW5_EUMVA|nr:hypothetical protein EVAR_71136_1 [Eumeta japonica]